MAAVCPAALFGAFAGAFGAETFRVFEMGDVLRVARFHFLGHLSILTGVLGAALAGAIAWKAEEAGAAEWTLAILSVGVAGMWYGICVLLGLLCSSSRAIEQVVRFLSSFLGPAACGFFAGYSLCGASMYGLAAQGAGAKLFFVLVLGLPLPAQYSLGRDGVAKLRAGGSGATGVRHICFALLDLGFSGLGYQLLAAEAGPMHWAVLSTAGIPLMRLLLPGLDAVDNPASPGVNVEVGKDMVWDHIRALVVYLCAATGRVHLALFFFCFLKAVFLSGAPAAWATNDEIRAE